MIELNREQRHIITSLCENSREVLVRSALEGNMGNVWVAELENPSYCLVHLGDFAYLVGIPPKAKESLELREQITESCMHDFITPSDERWSMWLNEVFMGEYRLVTRYALKKDEHHFDRDQLLQYMKEIPEGVKIKKIDERLYQHVIKEDWSRDLCGNYESAKHFLEYGMGYVAVKDRQVISGCSSYGSSQGMMEIEIQTKPEYRRKGLALACSAAFILECMDKGIYANWDAATAHSVSVAEKLGYVFEREYSVYHLMIEAEE